MRAKSLLRAPRLSLKQKGKNRRTKDQNKTSWARGVTLIEAHSEHAKYSDKSVHNYGEAVLAIMQTTILTTLQTKTNVEIKREVCAHPCVHRNGLHSIL